MICRVESKRSRTIFDCDALVLIFGTSNQGSDHFSTSVKQTTQESYRREHSVNQEKKHHMDDPGSSFFELTKAAIRLADISQSNHFRK
jgi:hypothetical protein